MMADNLDDAELRKNVGEIIKNGDLATLTSRKVRQILEKKYGVNLTHRKKQIDDIVMEIIDEESEDSDNNSSAAGPSKSDLETKYSKEVSVASTTKKEKNKVKEESASDEQESGNDDSETPTRAVTRKRPTAKNKEKRKDAKKPKTEGEGGKKKTGFSMPMLLSPELAALMGETHMARSAVVKRMWEIIKERNLVDPSNKRYTICDDELEKIIGMKRFMTFSMMKYLKKHVKDPALM